MEVAMPHTGKDPGYQGFRILQFIFVIAPLLAGLDKFANLLTDWSQYLSPWMLQMIPLKAKTFMIMVGIVEIIAGIGVAFKPKVFSYIVVLWLLAIVVQLFISGQYLDIALRDIGLMLSALALGRLSHKYAKSKTA